MANAEKHKKNPLLEWIDEEIPVAQNTRGGASQKLPKRVRRPGTSGEGQPIEPALLLREASQPPRTGEKHSQAHSREHLLKQGRIPTLRAPHSTKPGRAAGAGR